MCRIKIFCFLFWFVINFVPFSSAGRWSTYNAARQLEAADDVVEVEKDETTAVENLLDDNNTTEGSTEDDSLFWTVPDTNETTEENKIIQTDTQEMDEEADDKIGNLIENEETGNNFTEEATPTETSEMDEKIVLQRTNCNLEIAVKDTHDLKIQIKFGQFENRTTGKCCITLNGPENSNLAIMISNIHLYRNGSEGEVLKVIIANHGSAFVLREYLNESEYRPLILTETHKVYLVLYYNVSNVSVGEEETYFNLEVLTYQKYENHIQSVTGSYSNAFYPIKEPNWYKYYT